MFAMIGLGVGELIGAPSCGKVIDKLGSKAGVFFVLVNVLIAITLAFVVVIIYEFNYFCYIMTFYWGIQDSAANNLLNCILGFEFESKILPFSCSKLLKTLFVFAFLMIDAKIVE